MNANENIDLYITLCLQGEATQDQVLYVKRWMGESAANRQYFESMEAAYFHAPLTEHSFDTKQAWQRVEERIKPRIEKRVHWLNWRAIAAVFVLGIIGSWMWFKWEGHDDLVLMAAQGIETHHLPNGVRLTLNNGSKVAYNETKSTAWVELEGDGFFDVGKEVSKSFYVKTNDLVIRDIGTAFHVRNNHADDTLFVEVMEGMIVCYAGQNDSLRVGAGQRGYYCKSSNSMGMLVGQTNQSAYATKVFHFESATLDQVIADLQAVYPAIIQVSDLSMLDCTISVSFQNQSIEEILDVIAITMSWQLERTGQQWKLNGASCSSNL